MSKKQKKVPASLVWFEIPADDAARVNKFYQGLFDWTINPFPDMENYWHIDTGGHDVSPDGGVITRKHERQPITAYFGVASVTRSAAKVAKLGGTICRPKTAVPGMGYFAICRDTEGNEFAIWERNAKAK